MMKRISVIFCVMCFGISFWTIFRLNKKVEMIQSNYTLLQSTCEQLSNKMAEYIWASEPLSVEEVETFQHNLEILTEFYGLPSNRLTEIAKYCYSLKRSGQMESSWITSVSEHKIPENSYYSIEIVTEDEEHYWFNFDYNSSFIYAIFKGTNNKTLLYGVIE